MRFWDKIAEVIKNHCLTDGVDILPRGHLRAATKLKYLDGASIDVFLEKEQHLFDVAMFSDMGQTFAKLAEFGIRPKDREEMIREAISSLPGLRVVKDRLTVMADSVEQAKTAVIDLAQACVRISCLAFTRRSSHKRLFAERVKKFLETTKLNFEEGYLYRGPFQRDIKVDYRFGKINRPAAVLQLSGSHAQANEVFRKWYDLHEAKVNDNLITVYDDSNELEHIEDLERVERFSNLVAVSKPDHLLEILQAA